MSEATFGIETDTQGVTTLASTSIALPHAEVDDRVLMVVNPVDRIAQTNLQLYRQLMDQQWSEEALGLVANAYELALGLFAVQVRPNRK